MKPVILITATRYLMPMLLLLSAFLLFRGHNLPGGGFIGGLVAATTFTLHSFAFGVEDTRRLLRINPLALTGAGLLIALGAGIFGLAVGQPFMTGGWKILRFGSPDGVHVGTPLIFDVGVYLVVVGAALTIILSLAEGE
jgi:multisubunit Na+/H+ antiporter MnhB subunit